MPTTLIENNEDDQPRNTPVNRCFRNIKDGYEQPDYPGYIYGRWRFSYNNVGFEP
jgi:hypothetical protein